MPKTVKHRSKRIKTYKVKNIKSVSKQIDQDFFNKVGNGILLKLFSPLWMRKSFQSILN